MLWSEYASFVATSDQSRDKGWEERRKIAVYGVAAEIGSLLSAIKKAMLATEGDQSPVAARKRQQVREEIGDVLWYAVSLSQQVEGREGRGILWNDIRNLRDEMSASDERAGTIEEALTSEGRAGFLAGADGFLANDDFTMDGYQALAFRTARTQGDLLERVCLAVLTQLGAEVLRTTLPAIELRLNRKVADRDLGIVLGEVAWHLAALATLSGLSLDDIARHNQDKVDRRFGRLAATPLPDAAYPLHEQFPRRIDIAFVSVGKGRSRMYFEGRPLGNDLTDNAAEEDGYRFHDVMHLTILAKLGWSPVLRKLMGRKRKSDPGIDEVQDGARAQIVEELIIKSIHSEGTAYLDLGGSGSTGTLFANRGLVSFGFLSQVSRLAAGLEAGRNQLWEWEEAILQGSRLFHALRRSGQGTVQLDLDARTIAFDEDVYVDLPGSVVGVGSVTIESAPGASGRGGPDASRQADALKRAVLVSLGLDESGSLGQHVSVRPVSAGGLLIRADGPVQDAMWRRRAITFRVTWANIGGTLLCTAFAMSDSREAVAG